MMLFLNRYILLLAKRNTLISLITVSFLVYCTSACTDTPSAIVNKEQDGYFDYGTQSDSARYYFFKAWEEIMDNGRWTESEEAFRKAIEHDPDWLLGKSLVGRITRDLEERQKITNQLEANKYKAEKFERLLLDVNLLSLHAANNRDQGIKNTKESQQRRTQLALNNFGAFARAFPNDHYFKAEYIEHIYHNDGAKAALDTLNALATEKQLQLGFYISYKANLMLDLGNVNEAEQLYQKLIHNYNEPSFTSSLMLKAQLLMHQDSLIKAKKLVDKVVQMDSNHIIALGKQARLKSKLERRDLLE